MRDSFLKSYSIFFKSTLFLTLCNLSFAEFLKPNTDFLGKVQKECFGLDSYIPGGAAVPGGGVTQSQPDSNKRNACGFKIIDQAEEERKTVCDKQKDKDKTRCKELYDRMISRIRITTGISDLGDESMQSRCEARYNDDQEIFNECKKPAAKRAQSCAKFNESEETNFLNSDTMQGIMPLAGMVNGAGNLLGIYSAMTSNPGCSLSKEDFLSQKDKLETQAKDIEEKIRELRKEAEEAQDDFRSKMEEWSKREVEIADELTDIPIDTQEEKQNLIKEKTKKKMEADEQYAKVNAQISEASRKINELIDDRKIAVAGKSSFAIHDQCSEEAVGGDPKKDSANKQPSRAVQASFAGAFAQGKVLAVNVQKRYDACVKRESAILQKTSNSYDRALSALREAIKNLQEEYGRIAERKRLADEELTYAIQQLDLRAETKAAKLRNEYLNIQKQKAAAQAALVDKLKNLDSDSKKQSQKLAIMQMQLQQYQGKVPASTSDGKSMGELAEQCGSSFDSLISSFKEDCCDKIVYKGSGNSICRLQTAEDRKAAADAKKKNDPK